MSNDSSNAESQAPVQAKSKPKKVGWGPVGSIIATITLYFVAQVGAAVVLFLALAIMGWSAKDMTNWINQSTLAQFLYILLAETATVGGIIWLLRRRSQKLRDIGWTPLQGRYLTLALAGFGVYFVGYIIVVSVTSALIPSLNIEQKQNVGFEEAHTQLQLILTFVSLVLLPPIAEETVFRGFLFTNLRRRFSFLATTIIVSLLFAIPHLQFGEGAPLLWVAGLDTFVLSLVLCYVRERSNSIWPGVLIHMLKNGIAFIALFLFAH